MSSPTPYTQIQIDAVAEHIEATAFFLIGRTDVRLYNKLKRRSMLRLYNYKLQIANY